MRSIQLLPLSTSTCQASTGKEVEMGTKVAVSEELAAAAGQSIISGVSSGKTGTGEAADGTTETPTHEMTRGIDITAANAHLSGIDTGTQTSSGTIKMIAGYHRATAMSADQSADNRWRTWVRFQAEAAHTRTRLLMLRGTLHACCKDDIR